MSVHVPQPGRRRVVSLLWFPFFFVAAMSWLFSIAFAAPHPHHVAIGVVAQEEVNAGLDAALSNASGSFDVVEMGSGETARAQVASADLGAAVVCRTTDTACDVVIASAAGRGQATTVSSDVQVAMEQLGHPVTIVDVAPTAPGDRSGAGVFFFAFPLAMTGMVTSIVLLQLAMWPTGRKVAVIAGVGVFGSVVDWLIAVARDVLPPDPLLLVAGFFLVQAIAWVTTGMATFVRQFFLPIALTFVLLLGVPTSGGTVTAEMLPPALAVLHHVLPLGAFVDLVRATAYGTGSAALPSGVLGAWVVLGALLMGAAHRRRSAANRPGVVRPAPSTEEHTLTGVVTSLSGVPLAGAAVTVLDESGREVERASTDGAGRYVVVRVSTGLHHLVVTALHCEPAVLTVALPATRSTVQRDVRLEDWQDPAGNLTAEEIG